MGHATARGLAKIYGILANGGTLHGKQLLSEDAITRLNTVSSTGICQVKGTTITFSMGMTVSLPNSGVRITIRNVYACAQVMIARLHEYVSILLY